MTQHKGQSILIVIVAGLSGLLGAMVWTVWLSDMVVPPSRSVQIDPQTVETVIEPRIIEVREDEAIVDVVSRVKPAVVSIVAQQEGRDLFGRSIISRGGGTGFILTSDGLILTNKHVVDQDAAQYTVVLDNGETYAVQEILEDPFADLAYIRIDAENLPIATLGDSSLVRPGQRVVAIGNALAAFDNTVTTGVISALDRTVTGGPSRNETLQGVIQTDASINPGNSGGPLLDVAGRVIGVNTAIIQGGEQIAFAIPVNEVRLGFEAILEQGVVVRPVLGVRYVHVTPELQQVADLPVSEGALIFSDDTQQPGIVEDGPAAQAGLQVDDIIVRINDQKITETHRLVSALSRYSPGETVQVVYVRPGIEGEQTVEVTLGETRGSVRSLAASS